jgi:hypothetical protein
MGMFDFPTDFAVITLTDARDRTVCKFIKEKPDSGWSVEDKPMDGKHIQRIGELAKRGETLPPTRESDLAPEHLTRQPNGQQHLKVPGLTRRWETLPPVLDRLAANDIRRLTVDQLRACFD